jgi:hypothetical protein
MKVELDIAPALHARLVFEAKRRGTQAELLAVEVLVRALDEVRDEFVAAHGPGLLPGVDIADSSGLQDIVDEGVPIEKLR